MPVESPKTAKNIVAASGCSLYDVQERPQASRRNEAILIVRAVIVAALAGAALWWVGWKVIVRFWTLHESRRRHR